MFNILNKLFPIKNEPKILVNPPGKTFKKILTGEYFGCKDGVTDKVKIAKAKKDKINLIKDNELLPMYIRYSYKNDSISSAYVVFQKEIHAKKWNMLHVTELSFIIRFSNFDEFEKMSGFKLSKDFRDLTSSGNNDDYKSNGRRKEKRDQ